MIVIIANAPLRLDLLTGQESRERLEPLLETMRDPAETMCWFQESGSLLAHIRQPRDGPDVLVLEAGEGGLALARQLRQEACPLPMILLVETLEQALAGYEVSACRCVMAPPERAPVEEALAYCRQSYGGLLVRPREPGRSRGRTYGVRLRLHPEDILWFRIEGHVLTIHRAGEPPVDTVASANHLEAMLPRYFIRCHHGYIVNLQAAAGIQRNQLTLVDGAQIPISRNRYPQVLERYNIYGAQKKTC